jgi:hypothetical protein
VIPEALRAGVYRANSGSLAALRRLAAHIVQPSANCSKGSSKL